MGKTVIVIFPGCMSAVLGISAWEAADAGAPAACAIVSILAFMFFATSVGIFWSNPR